MPRFCLPLIFPATHHFLYTGMEGALANADSAATSEVLALCQNPGTGLYGQSALRGWDGGFVRKGNRLELSRSAKTRESACPRDCRVGFLVRGYGLTPREVILTCFDSYWQEWPCHQSDLWVLGL
jgi:hypothetical protein